MFGYIKTDVSNMYVKDTILYKSMYCGLCKGIGKSCGCRARLCLNYDLTFLSVLCHNLLNVDIKIEKQRCYIHWLKKRQVAIPDNLTIRIANLNVILAYNKVLDDILDNKKGKIKGLYFRKAYKKAKKNEPELNRIVEENYLSLIKKEKEHCDSFDIVSDCFGKMMKQIVCEIIGNKDESVSSLAYSLGKWIYLIDAIDDYDKDIKNKDYNVFVINGNDIKTQKEYISKNISDLQLLFGTVISDITTNASRLDYKFNHDLIDNILLKGIMKQTKNIL